MYNLQIYLDFNCDAASILGQHFNSQHYDSQYSNMLWALSGFLPSLVSSLQLDRQLFDGALEAEAWGGKLRKPLWRACGEPTTANSRFALNSCATCYGKAEGYYELKKGGREGDQKIDVKLRYQNKELHSFVS